VDFILGHMLFVFIYLCICLLGWIGKESAISEVTYWSIVPAMDEGCKI
jgi:hypothetical protein